MYKLKYLILITFMILMSFLLCAALPPSEKSQHNFDFELNIPDQHKIKIIITGQGTVLVNGSQKNTGDIITCKRFSSIFFYITPSDKYFTDKITFNDEDITSSLSSNNFTLYNINKDGTLTINFKANSKTINSPTNPIEKVKKVITNIPNYISTSDSSKLLIFILLTASFIYLIYYELKKRANKNTSKT